MLAATNLSDPCQPKRRGRPATFDREEALEIALDLFWRHGYDGVAVADLTTAIGIAAPSLYHAFGNKADLYREVLKRYGARGLSLAELMSVPSAYEAVRLLLEHGIKAATASGRPPGCMVSSGLLMTSADNAPLAADLKALRALMREGLERCITRDVELGILPHGTDATELARFYITILQGLSVQALDGATPDELSRVASRALAAWPLSIEHRLQS